jgi:hypothetical protein
MYGQQITLPETHNRLPSIFNNTIENLTTTNKIPITLVLDPETGSYDNSTGNFHINLGTDYFDATTNNLVIGNGITSNTLKTDKIFDVYLESVTTLYAKLNNTKATMAFKLNIKDWNIDNYSNIQELSNYIIIPNETYTPSNVLHKSKKLNYLTHLVPDKLSSISGNLSTLDNTGVIHDVANGRIIIEMILIPRHKLNE